MYEESRIRDARVDHMDKPYVYGLSSDPYDASRTKQINLCDNNNYDVSAFLLFLTG